jgi:hypothetical protein
MFGTITVMDSPEHELEGIGVAMRVCHQHLAHLSASICVSVSLTLSSSNVT